MDARQTSSVIVLITTLGLFAVAVILSTFALDSIDASLVERALAYISILCVFLGGFCLYLLFGDKQKQFKVAAKNEELEASSELFFELYENSPVPYLRIHKRGDIISANNAAIRMFKVEVGQLNGLNVFQLMGFADETRASLVPTEITRGIFINDEEAYVQDTNGARHWVLLSSFPYGHNNERLVTLFDITKQKEVDIAKSEFVSLASHQLRTPISAMKWNLELLEVDSTGPLNEKQREYIAKISRNAEKMHMLIQDFLDASQLETGTFATEPVDIDVYAFLENIYEEFVARINKKQLSLERHYENAGLMIHTDEHLLHNVISNLVSNAVKYTPEGGRVVVGYSVSQSEITFTVQDTGMGIPKPEQDKLFSKFFRASNARGEVTEGTGLGLYIVAKAVDNLGGTISVASEANQGTTFTVTVPRTLR